MISDTKNYLLLVLWEFEPQTFVLVISKFQTICGITLHPNTHTCTHIISTDCCNSYTQTIMVASLMLNITLEDTYTYMIFSRPLANLETHFEIRYLLLPILVP